MDLASNNPTVLAKDLLFQYDQVVSIPKRDKITPTSDKLISAYGRKWEWVIIPKLDKGPYSDFDILAYCGMVAEQNIEESHFWSIVAWFARVDLEQLKKAANEDGYTFVTLKYEDLPVKPNIQWVIDNFPNTHYPIALHVMASVYTVLLGKNINSLNTKYIKTRIERMKEMVNEPNISPDWVALGHAPKNFEKVTKFMQSTPHIRAVIFNAYKDNKPKDRYLPLVTDHTLQLLNGSFMTTQILIILQIASRAEVAALFVELRSELNKYLKWVVSLPIEDQKEIGYLRLKYGDDRTQPVSINSLPLCSYVAYELARSSSSTLDQYSGFDRMDDRKKAVGDKIVEWILKAEVICKKQTSYANSLGLPAQFQKQLADAFGPSPIPGSLQAGLGATSPDA
nr:MAG: hypothetical protein [brine shrimp arlivirus 7]